MQKDFHYYATYSAAFLSGYSHEESLEICYSAQFVDLCSRTLLNTLKAPLDACTTQLQLELMDARTDIIGLADITRIWSSFHFLPKDLYSEHPGSSLRYKNKYHLICGPNGDLVADTIKLAEGGSLAAVGLAMHVLADTWAHQYFAGTPSVVINNTNYHFFELLPTDVEGEYTERKVQFRNNPGAEDDLENGKYTNTLYQASENSIMNLGHGRCGHLPDYSFIRYKYMPAWGNYAEIIKDNPSDYIKAFTQMIYAMRYLRGEYGVFHVDSYSPETIEPYRDEIMEIICKRQLEPGACADWKAFGEKLSGEEIPDFDIKRYQEQYIKASAKDKDDTFIGQFINAALAQKSMVTNRIFISRNTLAGISIDFKERDFRGIRAFRRIRRQK